MLGVSVSPRRRRARLSSREPSFSPGLQLQSSGAAARPGRAQVEREAVEERPLVCQRVLLPQMQSFSAATSQAGLLDLLVFYMTLANILDPTVAAPEVE